MAAAFAHSPGVRDSVGVGTRKVSIRFDDGVRLQLYCVPPDEFIVTWFRATGLWRTCRRSRRAPACAG